MSDFPLAPPQLPVLGLGQIFDTINPNAPSSANWNAANEASYYPIRLQFAYQLASMYVQLGTISGTKNWDIGIYDRIGTRLWSSGSFAGTSGAFTVKTLTTPILLSPGTYYMALCADSATNNGVQRRSLPRTGIGNLLGMAIQATAFPLPATATFAANTRGLVPVMGIASITSY